MAQAQCHNINQLDELAVGFVVFEYHATELIVRGGIQIERINNSMSKFGH